MKPDDIYGGISVYYGVAVCHGCGAEEAFEGKVVDDPNYRKPQYKPTPSEGGRYVAWYNKHVKHRDPNAPDD